MTSNGAIGTRRLNLLRVLFLWGPPVVVSVIILALSSIPGNRFPKHPEMVNIVSHFFEFTLLGFLLARALSTVCRNTPRKLMIWTFLLCTVLGFTTELLQFTIPYRLFDVMDLFYDLLGTLTGITLFLAVRKKPFIEPMESGNMESGENVRDQ